MPYVDQTHGDAAMQMNLVRPARLVPLQPVNSLFFTYLDEMQVAMSMARLPLK